MTIKLEGLEQVKQNFKALEFNMTKDIASAMLGGGKLVEGEAKRLVSVRSMGETVTRYREGGGSYTHIASREGDAPNTDTGTLIKMIATEVVSDDVFVISKAEYSIFLEFGTVKMVARPFMFPAMEAKDDEVRALVVNAVNKAIENAGTV